MPVDRATTDDERRRDATPNDSRQPDTARDRPTPRPPQNCTTLIERDTSRLDRRTCRP